MITHSNVVFDRLSTPIGPLYVAVSSQGLVSIRLGGTLQGFVASTRSRRQVAPRRDRAAVRPFARQLQQYLGGRRKRFTLPIDWKRTSPFQRKILKATSRIPYGQTRTYGEVARQVGRRHAARAAGQALASNPFPLVIPCHRVLAADGSLGGYSAPGGVRLKRRLLRIEDATLAQEAKSPRARLSLGRPSQGHKTSRLSRNRD